MAPEARIRRVATISEAKAQLSRLVEAALADGRRVVLVSAASAREFAIKAALGRPDAPSEYLKMQAHDRFVPLAIMSEHALAVHEPTHHHRDPFDRMLIAQAGSKGLTIVAHDRVLVPYDVAVVMASAQRRRERPGCRGKTRLNRPR